ncbi:MAG: hypothetical protein ACP5NP_12930 [Acetobacteraceae bacterium]
MARAIAVVLLALALAGCQAPGSAQRLTRARPPDPTDGIAAIPACPSGIVAELNTGVRVAFAGAAADHPETCLRRIHGQTYRYYLGFWGDGTFSGGDRAERAAIRRVLIGPVGTSAEAPLAGAGPLALWHSVTFTHVGDPTLTLDGVSHPTLLVRVERHTDTGRGVRTETLWWLDRATLIPLQREEVIPTARGHEHQLAWRVRALTAAE